MDQLLHSIHSPSQTLEIYSLCKILIENNLNHLLKEICSFMIKNQPDTKEFKRLLAFFNPPEDPASSFSNLNSLYDLDFDIKDYTEILSRQNKLVPQLRDLYTEYPVDIIGSIMSSKGKERGDITFTMTTCKRLDLFVPTMNSFLRCCTDRNLISRWIIVDDNSSDSDRQEMMRLYPFCEFVFKDASHKGHPRSMNILRSMITTPYIFHMEDDWLFVHPAPYISMCMKVLDENPAYGQCLINKNYSETERDLIKGGFVKHTESGMGYVEHQYIEDPVELDRFIKTGPGGSVAYWPHYSFRPSLLHKRVWDISPFREDPCHFEMEHSHLYHKMGFKSAFLPGTYSLHTGKLTSETTAQKANAYALNEVSQFGSTLSASKSSSLSFRNPVMFDISSNIIKAIKSIPTTMHPRKVDTYCINLDRRPDRYQKFTSRWKNIKRFSAVDGDKLHFTPNEIRIWGANDHCWNRRIIGCAYSHMKLWKQLLDSDKDAYFIMEDDAVPMKNIEIIDRFINGDVGIDYDILFASYFEWNSNSDIKTGGWVDRSQPDKIQMVRMKSFGETCKHFMGGFCAYFISRSGAEKMLRLIDSIGMHYAIDTMAYRLADVGSALFMYPPLIESPLANFNTEIDSDIQRTLLPLLDYDTFIDDHIKYLTKLCNTYAYNISLQKQYPDEYNKRTVYVCDLTYLQISVDIPAEFDHYWLDQTRVVIVPQTMKEIIDNREGWRLSKRGVLDIDKLLC